MHIIRTKEGAQRRIDKLIRNYRKRFASGGQFGFDWRTMRLNDYVTYGEIEALYALMPDLPSRPKRSA